MHQLLPRTLAYLSEDKQGHEGASCFTNVEEWLAGYGVNGVPADDDNGDGWLTMLMDIIDTKELSFSDLNRKRKRLTFAAFQDPLVIAKAASLESLVGPNVRGMFRLFKRSDAIGNLHKLPSLATAEREKQRQQFLACLAVPSSMLS